MSAKLKTLVVGAILGASVALVAAPPSSSRETLFYGGVATGVNGAADITIQLVAGAQVRCTTSAPATPLDAGGGFRIALDETCNDAVEASAEPLAVRVTVNGSVLSPDQPLGAVPDALLARGASGPLDDRIGSVEDRLNALDNNAELRCDGTDAAPFYGSTHVTVRRLICGPSNLDVAVTTTGTDGTVFTVQRAGLYFVSYTDRFSTPTDLAITHNVPAADLTVTSVNAMSSYTTSVLQGEVTVPDNGAGNVATMAFLAAGDQVRMMTSGAQPTLNQGKFAMVTMLRVR